MRLLSTSDTRSGADAVYRAVVCLPNIQERFDIYSGRPFASRQFIRYRRALLAKRVLTLLRNGD